MQDLPTPKNSPAEADAAAAEPSNGASAETRDPSLPDPHAKKPREIGGRPGPDPTRYGDWEKNGRCIDF
jgi:hypothetical protein